VIVVGYVPKQSTGTEVVELNCYLISDLNNLTAKI